MFGGNHINECDDILSRVFLGRAMNMMSAIRISTQDFPFSKNESQSMERLSPQNFCGRPAVGGAPIFKIYVKKSSTLSEKEAKFFFPFAHSQLLKLFFLST